MELARDVVLGGTDACTVGRWPLPEFPVPLLTPFSFPLFARVSQKNENAKEKLMKTMKIENARPGMTSYYFL